MNAAPPRRLVSTLVPVYAAAALRLMVPLLLLPLMASRLGAETFGRLGFIAVWGGLLSLVVEGGFLASATRLAVRADGAGRWALASRVSTARCVLTAAVLPLAAVVAVTAAPGGTAGVGDRAADAVAIAALAVALGWPANWYLQATQQLGAAMLTAAIYHRKSPTSRPACAGFRYRQIKISPHSSARRAAVFRFGTPSLTFMR